VSTLQAISHQHTSSPLILDILLLHNDLYNCNFDIIFFWIPSHVGIVGYTKVDLLARIIIIIIIRNLYSAIMPLGGYRTPSLSPITNIPIALAATDFLSMSTQSFKINGNLVGIYILTINCTKFTQTFLLFLRYLTLFLEKNKLL